MNSAIVKGFFKFYPVIFHKKGRFAGIFRICGDGELVFEILWGGISGRMIKGGSLLKETKGGSLPADPPF